MFEDTRTQFTKKKIKDSFFSLLKEKDLSQITVKSICEASCINRSTFYRYYTDVYDLLEKIEEEYLVSFENYLNTCTTLEDAVTAMIRIADSHSDLFLVLASDHADQRFIDKMIDQSYAHYQGGFSRRYPNLSEHQKYRLYLYIARGCITLLVDWLRHHKPDPVDVLIADSIRFSRHMLSIRS